MTPAAIPPLAFGTGTSWSTAVDAPLDAALVTAIMTALHTGFRHLDGAESYNNERELGAAVAAAAAEGVMREEVFVTTKLWPTVSDAPGTFARSLTRLGVSYVDLYLLHCPFFTPSTHGVSVRDVWTSLESLHTSGAARQIGVSNFNTPQLRSLLGYARVRPAVNQVELHPYCCDEELLRYCAQEGVAVAGYSPLAPLVRFRGGPLDAVLERVAGEHAKTQAQVLLKWVRQRGALVVATTGKEDRMREVLEVEGDWELTEEEVKEITSVGRKHRRRAFWKKEYAEADAAVEAEMGKET